MGRVAQASERSPARCGAPIVEDVAQDTADTSGCAPDRARCRRVVVDSPSRRCRACPVADINDAWAFSPPRPLDDLQARWRNRNLRYCVKVVL